MCKDVNVSHHKMYCHVWCVLTSEATSQSGLPSLSFSSTYGLSWTRFRSSCRPSRRKASSSWESCCWKPLNRGAYLAIVHQRVTGTQRKSQNHRYKKTIYLIRRCNSFQQPINNSGSVPSLFQMPKSRRRRLTFYVYAQNKRLLQYIYICSIFGIDGKR